MSLTVKPVYRSRPFIFAPYLYDVAAERWRVAVSIDNCAMNHLDPKASCHIVKGRQRHRKVGPSHPLWIYKCLIHICWFTIYPPGWVPFGRRSLVDLDSQGEAVTCQDHWESTEFGAVVDEAKKKHWPQTSVELLRMISNDVFYYATRKTQIRHAQGGISLLALNADATRRQQNVRLGLGIDLKSYQEANARIRDGPDLAALGAACTGLLRSLQRPSMRLFLVMVRLGEELGFWGTCAAGLSKNTIKH